MVNKQEIEYLTEEKLRQGEDFPEINEDIKRLKSSQIIFKNQKKEIDILKELTEKQDKLIKEQQNKIFKLRIEVDSQRNNKREVLKENGKGDINDLKRIILILGDSKNHLCLTTIQRECILSREKTLSCLGFLEKHNIIFKNKDIKNNDTWYIEKR